MDSPTHSDLRPRRGRRLLLWCASCLRLSGTVGVSEQGTGNSSELGATLHGPGPGSERGLGLAGPSAALPPSGPGHFLRPAGLAQQRRRGRQRRLNMNGA